MKRSPRNDKVVPLANSQKKIDTNLFTNLLGNKKEKMSSSLAESLTLAESEAVASYLEGIADHNAWSYVRTDSSQSTKGVNMFCDSYGGRGNCFRQFLVLEKETGTTEFVTLMADTLLAFGVSLNPTPSVLDQRSLVRMLIAKCNEQVCSR